MKQKSVYGKITKFDIIEYITQKCGTISELSKFNDVWRKLKYLITSLKVDVEDEENKTHFKLGYLIENSYLNDKVDAVYAILSKKKNSYSKKLKMVNLYIDKINKYAYVTLDDINMFVDKNMKAQNEQQLQQQEQQ